MKQDPQAAVDYLESKLSVGGKANFSVSAAPGGDVEVVIDGLEIDKKQRADLISNKAMQFGRKRDEVEAEIGGKLLQPRKPSDGMKDASEAQKAVADRVLPFQRETTLSPQQQLDSESNGAINRVLNAASDVIDSTTEALARGAGPVKAGIVSVVIEDTVPGQAKATIRIKGDALLDAASIAAKVEEKEQRDEALKAPKLDGVQMRRQIRDALNLDAANVRDYATPHGRQEFSVRQEDTSAEKIHTALVERFFPGANGDSAALLSVKEHGDSTYSVRFNESPQGYKSQSHAQAASMAR